MPDLSAQAALLRGPHRYKGYLSVPQETVVFSRAVNMASISYPVLQITFDNPYSGVGAYTDVEAGMELILYSGNTSTIKGRLRVAAGASSATVLQVNEFSESRIDLDDNDRFEVLRSYRLRDKLIGAKRTFPKDSRTEYTNQTALVKPLPRTGGHWAGKLVGGTAVIPFFGSLGEVRDPDSVSGTKSYAWTTSGGTLSSPTAADPTLTASAAGTYWVKQTLTDSSNSQTEVQRAVVRVHDDNDPPIPVSIQSLPGTSTDAWSCTFRTHANAGIDTLPDGAMVMYWEEESYGSTAGSYGNRIASRSHIKFTGYLVRNSIRMDWKTGEVVFEAVSPLGVLRQLQGFSQVLTAVASPDTWQEWKTPLKTNDVLVYLLRWHTTALELFDLILPGYNYDYPEFFIQKQTPAGQVSEIADAVDATFKADRTGALYVKQDLSLVGSAARSAAVTTYNIQNSDIIDAELTYEHRIRVGHLIGRGFSTTGTPLQAETGKAPGEGEGTEQVDRLIVSAQSPGDQGLNQRTGRRFAKSNKTYYGKPVPKLVLTLRGGYDVFDPAYDEWVTVTLSRTISGRAVSFTAAKFQVESVDIRHEKTTTPAGTETWYKRITLTLIGETNGVAGIAINRKVKTRPSGITPVTVVPTIPLTPPSLIPPWVEGSNQVPLGGFIVNAEAAQAARFTAIDTVTGVITSTDISTGMGGSGMWAASDPFDYRRKYIATTAGIEVADNFKAFTSWASVATNTAIFGSSGRVSHKLITSINKRGWMMAMSHSMIAASFNRGASWTVTDPGSMSTYGTGTLVNASGDIAVSPHNSSASGDMWVYASVYVGVKNGNQFTCNIYHSGDGGLTWTLLGARFVGAGTIAPGCRMVVPYKDETGALNVNGPNQQIIIYEGRQGGGRCVRTTKSAISTGTNLYSFFTGSTPYPVAMGQAPVNVFTGDGSYWWGGLGQGSTHGVVRGINTTTSVTDLGGPTSYMVNVNGWPLDPLIAITWVNQRSGTATHPASITFDGGVTWYHGVRPVGWTGNNTAYAELDLSDYIAPQ